MKYQCSKSSASSPLQNPVIVQNASRISKDAAISDKQINCYMRLLLLLLLMDPSVICFVMLIVVYVI